MATETIREFLIKLGFKTDTDSLKKFTNTIEDASKTVLKFAAAIEATALTVALGVERFASNMENLYFASKRTGTSVTMLKALDVTMQNFGASAGETLSSMEALAELLRSNPGGVGGFLAGLGVQVKHLKDGSADIGDVYKQLAVTFQREPYLLAKLQAGQLGMSDHVLQALRDPRAAGELTRVLKETPAGFDKAATDAHAFEIQIRDLGITFQAFGAQVLDALQNKLGFSLKDLQRWMETNGAHVAQQLIDGVEKLWVVAGWLEKQFLALMDALIKLDKSTDGWSTKIIGLAFLLQASGVGSVVGGVLNLTAAFIRLGTGIAGAGAAASASGLLGFLGSLGAVGAAGGLGWLIGKEVNKFAESKLGDTIGGSIYEWTHRGQAALRFFQDRGWSAAQSAGIVANIRRESGFLATAEGDGGQAYGLMQWHPDRQAAFKKHFGHDIHGSSEQEQLEFLNYEMTKGSEQRAGNILRSMRNANDAGAAVSRYYARPGDANGEAKRRGADAANIYSTVNITVSGAGDPNAVAKKVKGIIDRQTSQATRNVAVAVQ
jgi:Phage tail lysozyme